MTIFRHRWFEVAVIVVTGSAALLYWLGLLALPLLYGAVIFGLVPLVRTAVHDLVRERKIGTELFISIATVIAMVGGEYVAGAVMLSIILIASLLRTSILRELEPPLSRLSRPFLKPLSFATVDARPA
jgi:cation transport ATPase